MSFLEREQGNIHRPSHLAPMALSLINQGRVENLRKTSELSYPTLEERCCSRRKLCAAMRMVDQGNLTWEFGTDFFEAFPKGVDAVWEVAEDWSIFREDNNSDRQLVAPPGVEKAFPREFIDLSERVLAQLVARYEGIVNPESLSEGQIIKLKEKYPDFFDEAEKSRRDSLIEYDLIKRGLLMAGKTPLLCNYYISTMLDMGPENPTCLIGLSADEILAYSILSKKKLGKDRPAPPLLGLNVSFSPAIEQMIMENKIHVKDINEVGVIRPKDLKPGETYVARADITNGLPITQGEYNIGMLYVWHHIERAKRDHLLRELADYAARRNDSEVNLAIIEAASNRQLARMVLETNHWLGNESAGFDAFWGTTISEGQTQNGFRKYACRVDRNVPWTTDIYPGYPDTTATTVIQNWGMPYQQVRLRAY